MCWAATSWVVRGLALAACACSSGGGAEGGPASASGNTGGNGAAGTAAEPAAGGTTAADGSGEGAPASTPEGQDPNALGNVTPVETPASPSPGCGQKAALSSGEQSIEVGGVTRTYVLDVPAGYDGTAPQPLVFAFHGATTSGEFFRSRFYGNLLSTMADAAILVHPDALGDPTAWDNTADVPFFDAMLEQLSAELCVDSERVFATGHSSGGFFTNTLGCQRGDVLRAIAPVSAGGPFRFGGAGCTGEVAVWLAHAENDETVAFQNGVDSRDRWLEANGCSTEVAPVQPAPCVEYSGCDAGLPVRWCVYQDGHNWPEFGPEGIWSFFSGL